MHAIAFGLKRAFQSTLRLTRREFVALEITAARFDMLTAISRGYQRSCPQRDLRGWLGVTAATISRMLRSLEKLGYVTRERSSSDRRQHIVRLTARGLFIMRRAFAVVGRGVDLAFDTALTDGNPFGDSATLIAMDEAESMLKLVRSWFRDVAVLYYPWLRTTASSRSSGTAAASARSAAM